MIKVTLENFYSNLIAQHEEQEMRQKKLEKVMEEEGLKAAEKRLRSTCSEGNKVSSFEESKTWTGRF
ncbi:hypothetical protein MJG53_004903 [Ovis ammon polii x Ovis aries]|uniref:Uncharacterized protein n=1 Tax=Ovis ammon polii x Ovis aries TaxID=2918886 RepID=A0ACB9VAZ0_9CETA|nr:hypothetical protein MJG53_004903 [Ovis ammon polii x Ovis aries]